MTQKLGKGLDALIPDLGERKEKVVYLKIEDITPSRYQPRERFDEAKLSELTASIREKGVIQPVLVRPKGDGKYELIAGERRLRAVRSLEIKEMPALVREVEDVDALEISLIENIQREELNPIDEAHAYRRLSDEFNFTQEKIGQTIGKDRSTVANMMRLLLLPKKIQEFVENNTISMGHARTILSLEGEKERLKFCNRIVKKGLSVRQTENLAKTLGAKPRARLGAVKDHNIAAVEEELQHFLGTKVRIVHGKKRGKIEIQYYSNDDLDRILRLIKR